MKWLRGWQRVAQTNCCGIHSLLYLDLPLPFVTLSSTLLFGCLGNFQSKSTTYIIYQQIQEAIVFMMLNNRRNQTGHLECSLFQVGLEVCWLEHHNKKILHKIEMQRFLSSTHFEEPWLTIFLIKVLKSQSLFHYSTSSTFNTVFFNVFWDEFSEINLETVSKGTLIFKIC